MKILVVCNRGGHLTEALQLFPAFEGHDVLLVVPHNVRDQELQKKTQVLFSMVVDANLFRFLIVFIWAIKVILNERPNVILSTGTENAIPFFFWGRLFGVHTIYLESWCRVTNLSITGKILYQWAEEFWVQWPELQLLYPRSKYHGSVI